MKEEANKKRMEPTTPQAGCVVSIPRVEVPEPFVTSKRAGFQALDDERRKRMD